MVEGLLVPDRHSLGLSEGQPLGVGGGGIVGGPKGDRVIKAANVAQAENYKETRSLAVVGPRLLVGAPPGPLGLLDGEGQHKFQSNWSSLQLQLVDSIEGVGVVVHHFQDHHFQEQSKHII